MNWRETARILGGQWLRPAAALTVLCALFSHSKHAHAEASSWVFVGGGAGRLEWSQHQVTSAAMRIEGGAGTTPAYPVVVGIGGRITPYFEEGVDWSAYARVATRSYVTGGFGLAADAGAYARAFGGDSTGYQLTLNLGIPWGFVVAANFDQGSENHKTFALFAGLDFARLTVYRLSGEKSWPNVFPGYRPEDPSHKPPPAKPTESTSSKLEICPSTQSVGSLGM